MNEDNDQPSNGQLPEQRPPVSPPPSPAPPPPDFSNLAQKTSFQSPYTQTYEQQSQQPAEPKSHLKIIIIVVVILLIIIGGGVALLLARNSNETVEDNLISKDIIEDNEIASSDNEIASDEEESEPESEESPNLFADQQRKGRNTMRKNDINSMFQKLEEFYNENGFYPSDEFSVSLFPGIDQDALVDPDGNKITQLTRITLTEPSNSPYTSDKPATSQYTYYAYSCDSAESGSSNTCGKYAIYAWLESEEVYIKYSLN